MIILIDNYDSFTYNLVQYFGDLGQDVDVYRNDKITVEAVLSQKPQAVVISPGPGSPDTAGLCLTLTRACAEKSVPLFGVCLGLQTIGQAFGGSVVRAALPMHGKTSSVSHNKQGVFKDLPSPLTVTRYHSLIVEKETLPDDLQVTAWTQDGEIMGLSHKTAPIHSVQFHPESIATEKGHAILKNFISLI